MNKGFPKDGPEIKFVFQRSKSPAFPEALDIAKTSDRFDDTKCIDGNKLYEASFALVDTETIWRLSRLISGWQSTRIFINGKQLINTWTISTVMNCIMEALRCDDWRAHCLVVEKKPSLRQKTESCDDIDLMMSAPDVDKFHFVPCRHIARNNVVQVEHLHPATAWAQIQAMAVKNGCYWCPFLDVSLYRDLGFSPCS